LLLRARWMCSSAGGTEGEVFGRCDVWRRQERAVAPATHTDGNGGSPY